MVFNKDNKKEISAIEDLVKAKVYVNAKRFEELTALKNDIWSRALEVAGEPCTLLCFNLSPVVEDGLRSLDGYTLQVEQISEDPADPTHKEGRKRFLKVFGGERLKEGRVVAIIHELSGQDDQLTLLDRRVLALSLLNKLPVVVLATRSAHVLPEASAVTGDTWPVFFVPRPEEDMRPVCKWLAEELPRVRALSTSIEADLQSRVAHLGRVNAPLHFLSRASVALVPFGVMTVNFLGILRLIATMLQCVGMRGDTSANKALGFLGAKNAALVTAIDSMGDVYSFAVFATVLADLQGLGLVEAAAAMDVLDGLMLGSISVVTGAVSALGAYLSRPVVVRAAAEFLASLQTIYVLNPAMRRPNERRPRGSSKGKRRKQAGRKGRKEGSGEEAEELRGLLQRTRDRSPSSRTAAARVTAAAEVLEGAQEEAEELLLEGFPDGDGSSSSSGSNVEGVTEEEGKEEASSEKEKEESGDSEARPGPGQGVEAVLTANTCSSGPGSLLSVTLLAASRDDDAGQLVGDVNLHKKLSRVERKQQASVQKHAAREARAAKAASKAAAKAEKVAAKVAERTLKRQAKQQLQEQKAAEKAAVKLAKARVPSQLDVVAAAEAGEGASSASGDATGKGKSDTAVAASAKMSWWQSRKAAIAAAKALKGGKREDGAPGTVLEGADGTAMRLSRSSSSGDSTANSEEGSEEQVESALLREERLGLNQETCRALMEFLALPDEEVYDPETSPPPQGSDVVARV